MQCLQAIGGDGRGSAAADAFDPAELKQPHREGGAEGACEVLAPLTPIETRDGEGAALLA